MFCRTYTRIRLTPKLAVLHAHIRRHTGTHRHTHTHTHTHTHKPQTQTDTHRQADRQADAHTRTHAYAGTHIFHKQTSNLRCWHALTPSPHVWLYFDSPTSPHFSNQAPPRAQQLRLPDCFIMPHLLHPEDTTVVVRSVS